MIRKLSDGFEDLRVAIGLGSPGEDQVDVGDARSARALLARFLDDPQSLATLRDLTAQEPEMHEPSSLDDHELVEALATRIADRGFRLERLARTVLATFGEEVSEEPAAPRRVPTETT